MWLVLCFPYDAAAHWAAAGLRARGLAPVRIVHAEELAQWCRWEHRVGAAGTRSRLALADGCVVDDDSLRGVLNRLPFLPPGPLNGAEDRAYVTQELRALFWSWLASLRVPVVDPPGPYGFAGPGHVSEWLPLAARAGLQAPVYRMGSRPGSAGGAVASSMYAESPLFPPGTPARTVLVVGGEAFDGQAGGDTLQAGEADEADGIGAACVRLAAAAELPLLGVDLVATGDAGHRKQGWTFAGANAMPDLRIGGEPALDALARRLCREVAA
jgi:hypothetical protein